MFAVLAAVLAFTNPIGFTENAKVDARASWVAGKPIRAYCASSPAVWQAFLSSIGDTVADVGGVTPVIGGTETYLSPDICAPLYARIRSQSVYMPSLGASLLILAHESTHAKGDGDEGSTECRAIRLVPSFAATQWGFKKTSYAYSRLMYGALSLHHRMPPPYHTVC